jgi:CheY-like chemotaxis protein
VVISVTDNGSGMSDDVRAHLFEPFFTTKEPGKGTGLGLATVFGIVQQNNGVIEVDSAPGRGSTFRIMLPMIDVEFPVATVSPAQDTLSGRETILLVEDEAVILQVGMISLQRLGYSVLVASTPDIALRVAREYDGIIHLLITDVILPGVNGPELAQQIARIKPGIACLFMSGYTADVISDRSVLDESVNFIQKPFTIPDLAAKIRSVLDFV